MTAAKRGNAGVAAVPEAVEDTGPALSRRDLLVAVAAALALVGLVAIGAWIAFTALDRPLSTAPDRAELVALDERLTKIQNTIKPIAASFAAEPATGLIDVGSYRTRILAARDLVDSTNGLTVTSSQAIEVRDLIITGGSQVLSGMSAALDALQADDASATAAASGQVEEGLAALQDARDKLDALLGRKSRA